MSISDLEVKKTNAWRVEPLSCANCHASWFHSCLCSLQREIRCKCHRLWYTDCDSPAEFELKLVSGGFSGPLYQKHGKLWFEAHTEVNLVESAFKGITTLNVIPLVKCVSGLALIYILTNFQEWLLEHCLTFIGRCGIGLKAGVRNNSEG